MCSATQAVKCGVTSSSPSSLASVSLSFRSTCTILLFHFVILILLVVILYQFIPLFSRSHFSHMFSLYSHGILGVVLTDTASAKFLISFAKSCTTICTPRHTSVNDVELVENILMCSCSACSKMFVEWSSHKHSNVS